LSWTRESQSLKFSRAMSGRSAASATHLPCREGSTFPHPAGVAGQAGPRGSFGAERKSPRGLSPCPDPPGVPNGRATTSQSPPGTPEREKRRGSGRVGCARTDPVPCGTGGPSRVADHLLRWQDLLEGGQFPDQALECQEFHGCWRGRPPTILMRLSKNRSD